MHFELPQSLDQKSNDWGQFILKNLFAKKCLDNQPVFR